MEIIGTKQQDKKHVRQPLPNFFNNVLENLTERNGQFSLPLDICTSRSLTNILLTI